jgi:hypothetical protein
VSGFHLSRAPTPTRTSYAVSGHYEVRLTDGLKCPHCSRLLHAADVDICGQAAVRMICAGCHRDVLTIGSAS